MKIIFFLMLYIININLLYNRKKKWAKSTFKWYFVILLACIGVVLMYIEGNIRNDLLLNSTFFTPFIYSIIDLSFTKLSFYIHNRDLYLWLRNSNDIDNSKLSGGKHVRASDRLFSIILLLLVITLPILLTMIISFFIK